MILDRMNWFGSKPGSTKMASKSGSSLVKGSCDGFFLGTVGWRVFDYNQLGPKGGLEWTSLWLQFWGFLLGHL